MKKIFKEIKISAILWKIIRENLSLVNIFLSFEFFMVVIFIVRIRTLLVNFC